MPKTLIGLDFGHGVVRAAEVTPGGKHRPLLHRYREAAIPEQAVKDGVVVDQEAVVAALRELWSQAGFKTRLVVLGMGSQQVLTREITLPRMPLTHLRETLPFRVQDLLPLPVEDAVLDFFPAAEVDGDDGPQLRGLLVAATREAVLANAMAAQTAGLTVVDIDLIPFAIVRSELGGERSGTELMLHVGAASSSIIVAEKGVPQFVRVVPAGGGDVTAALVDALSIDPGQADELKRRIGMLDTGHADPESIAVVRVAAGAVNDLLRAVRSTIAFYANAHPDATFERIVLSGGGSTLRGFAEALAEAVDLPVSTGNAGERFALADELDEASFIAAGPAPAVALGLTMRSAA